MIKKLKSKKIYGVFAVFCSFLLCLLVFCSYIYIKPKNTLDVGAAGFGDVTGQNEPVLSIEYVYSDNSTYLIENAYYESVSNGMSLMSTLYNFKNQLEDCVSFYCVLDFGSTGFYNAKYDLYLSSSSPVWSTQVFDMQGRSLLATINNEYLLPMDIYRLGRVTLNSVTEVSHFSKILFRFDAYFFRSIMDMYEQGYYNYYIFTYDDNAFVDYNTAYNQGYDVGYGTGESAGKEIGYNQGYNEGYTVGFDSASSGKAFYSLIGAVIDVPVQTFFGLFNFDLLGVNIASFILSIFTLSVVIWLLKTFIL